MTRDIPEGRVAQVKVEADVARIHRAESEACLHAFVTGTCAQTSFRTAESKSVQ